MKEDMAFIFGPNGPLAQKLGSGYRPREGQIRMAELVWSVLNNEHHAFVEAGTGIGKSWAYSVPTIHWGHPALISTANKTLQTQLVGKDLPFLKRCLPRPFTFALLKGRASYICNARLAEMIRCPSPMLDLDLISLCAALPGHPDGDLDALGVWGKPRDELTISHEECPGEECPFWDECYFQNAHMQVELADIVVVNHALLANIVLGRSIPLRKIVVVDEAHELRHYMAEACSRRITLPRITRILRTKIAGNVARATLLSQAEEQARALFERMAPKESDRGSRTVPDAKCLAAGEALTGLLTRFTNELKARPPAEKGANAEEAKSLRASYALTVSRAEHLMRDLEAVFGPVKDRWVRYIERDDAQRKTDGITIYLQPLHVGGVLRKHLFDKTDSVICTSATLGLNGDLGHFARGVGMAERRKAAAGVTDGADTPPKPVEEDIIASPYDYEHQTRLYIPAHLRPPRPAGKPNEADRDDEAFLVQLAGEIGRLLRASRGRALVLFTSRLRMQKMHACLSGTLPFRCLLQGEMPRDQLLRTFQEDVSSALFATRSFWSGVDISGQSLSLVIMERPPIPAPGDPVYDSQCAEYDNMGESGFLHAGLSDAIQQLRQGAGRLIRRETDCGVIAILDSRLLTEAYGRWVKECLYPGKPVADFRSVEEYFQTHVADEPVVTPPVSESSKSAEKPRPKPGAFPVLNGYHIERMLGEGAYGVVYQGVNGDGRKVAIKEVMPDRVSDLEAIGSFLEEARAATQLAHPHIVGLLEVRIKKDRIFLVLPFMPGENLQQRLATGPLTPPEVTRLGIELCEALAEAHWQGITHRNIKPTNILFDEDGSVRLAGFGAASLASPLPGLDHRLIKIASLRDGVRDRIRYMAPEQVREDGTSDCRSDLYSVGAILYRALVGHDYLNLDGYPTLDRWERAILTEPPLLLPPEQVSADPRLAAVILRALHKDPGARFSNAEELLESLSGGWPP